MFLVLSVNHIGDSGDGTCNVTFALRDALATASDGDIITFAAIIQKQTADTIGTVRISMTALNVEARV